MALSSMTGFSQSQGQHGGLTWIWEIKAVNGRGFELRSRLPSGYDALDVELRRRLAARVSRGSLNVSLQTRYVGDAAPITVNEAALRAVLDVARRFEREHRLAPTRIDALMALPGIVENAFMSADEDELAARDEALLRSFDEAVDGLLASRRKEGAALFGVLSGLIDEIERLTTAAANLAATQPAAIRERFLTRAKEFLGDLPQLNQDRVVQEVALLANKADVREEIDRLTGHIAAARDLLKKGEAVGRKLDFLSQEFNREANTLCSKSQDLELTNLGIELKNTINQFREQVQNIE